MFRLYMIDQRVNRRRGVIYDDINQFYWHCTTYYTVQQKLGTRQNASQVLI